jgi:hypothetical protein
VTTVTDYCRQMSGDGRDSLSVVTVKLFSCGHSTETDRAPSGVHGDGRYRNNGKMENIFITKLVYKRIKLIE